MRPKVLGAILYGFVRFVGTFERIKLIDFPQAEEGAIFCGWHGRSLLFAHRFRNQSWWVVISHSNDGEMQTNIFRRLGFQIIRGSTNRGGVRAAVEAIRVLKSGGTLAMTPDGPRGPSGVVQGGVMLMAQKSGARLIPVGISARPRFLVNSWDRYMIPALFGRAVMIFGEGLTVPRDAAEDEVEQIRLRLEGEMHRLQFEADRELGL